MHVLAFISQFSQGDWQLLHIWSDLSPKNPAGQVATHVLLLRKLRASQLMHSKTDPPEQVLQGAWHGLHWLSLVSPEKFK